MIFDNFVAIIKRSALGSFVKMVIEKIGLEIIDYEAKFWHIKGFKKFGATGTSALILQCDIISLVSLIGRIEIKA